MFNEASVTPMIFLNGGQFLISPHSLNKSSLEVSTHGLLGFQHQGPCFVLTGACRLKFQLSVVGSGGLRHAKRARTTYFVHFWF